MAIPMKAAKIPVWPTIGNGLLVGCAMGLVNGLLVLAGQASPFIATLGMMSIARGAAFTISGGSPVYSLPESFLAISGRIGIVPIPALIMVAIFVLGGLVLKYTKLGRYTYAIGGNERSSSWRCRWTCCENRAGGRDPPGGPAAERPRACSSTLPGWIAPAARAFLNGNHDFAQAWRNRVPDPIRCPRPRPRRSRGRPGAGRPFHDLSACHRRER